MRYRCLMCCANTFQRHKISAKRQLLANFLKSCCRCIQKVIKYKYNSRCFIWSIQFSLFSSALLITECRCINCLSKLFSKEIWNKRVFKRFWQLLSICSWSDKAIAECILSLYSAASQPGEIEPRVKLLQQIDRAFKTLGGEIAQPMAHRIAHLCRDVRYLRFLLATSV